MRISDWSSDVCSSDLSRLLRPASRLLKRPRRKGLGLSADRLDVSAGWKEIGRASCRERVSVRVDLGGRRIIKKKKYTKETDNNEVSRNIITTQTIESQLEKTETNRNDKKNTTD